MEQKRYCPACGAELNSNGICTNEKCARRKIQLRKQEAEAKVKSK